jgi:hypothetical protein
MNAGPAIPLTITSDVPVLLRGEEHGLAAWLAAPGWRRAVWCMALIVLGAACYGATIGCWRSPFQALYTAVKFPLILLLTATGNALINSILAPLLGLNVSFRQSLQAVLMCFAIVALILGAFSPLVLFMMWNLPSLESSWQQATLAFNWIKVSQVGIIAFAGVAAHARLTRLLQSLSGSRSVALRVVCAWLGVNLLLGAQLTWILRPFFGSPHYDVEFLRDRALEGNFFETVFHSVKYMLTH